MSFTVCARLIVLNVFNVFIHKLVITNFECFGTLHGVIIFAHNIK